MDFSWALSALKAGLKITRTDWCRRRYLWLKPATRIPADWCKDSVLKKLAEDYAEEGGIPASATISTAWLECTGFWRITTGWNPQQYDLFADDWQVYFSEGHEKLTPEEVAAYKKLMLERMPGGPFSQQMLELGTLKAQQEKADIDKLPKAGSMENCEILSNAINQLLERIGVMPHLTVTLVPGPEDKELLISIEERSDHGASNFPLYVADVDGIIKTNIGSPVKSTKTVAGGYEAEDMQSNLGKED